MNTNNQDDLNIIKNGIFSSKEHPKASADVCGIWFSTNNIESIENFSKKYSRSMDDIASTSKGIFTKKKRVAELLLQEGFVLIGDSNINDNTDILEGKKLKKKKVGISDDFISSSSDMQRNMRWFFYLAKSFLAFIHPISILLTSILPSQYLMLPFLINFVGGTIVSIYAFRAARAGNVTMASILIVVYIIIIYLTN